MLVGYILYFVIYFVACKSSYTGIRSVWQQRGFPSGVVTPVSRNAVAVEAAVVGSVVAVDEVLLAEGVLQCQCTAPPCVAPLLRSCGVLRPEEVSWAAAPLLPVRGVHHHMGSWVAVPLLLVAPAAQAAGDRFLPRAGSAHPREGLRLRDGSSRMIAAMVAV